MKQRTTLEGVEVGVSPEHRTLPVRPGSMRAGIRVNVQGRSIRLRGLRRQPSGILRWLLILGPGLIAGAAGNDAGGIATYSQVGAKFGYEMLWILVLITISLAVVQEMAARLGAATGRGLLDLIRERFGIAASLLAVVVVLLVNGGLIVSEFAAIGAAMELFGVGRLITVPIAAVVIGYLVIFGSYNWIEKIFLVMTLVFFAYPVAAVLAHPNWGDVARGLTIPKVEARPDYLVTLVALLGATLTPYQQIFQQSSVVEKGIARRHYGPERIDTYAGAVLSNLMSAFIIIATAATLHAAGKTDLNTAAEAAKAFEPVAGKAGEALFAVGLVGAAALAAAVLPLATAYSIAEVFGFPKGVDFDFRRARTFFGLFVVLLAGGAGIAMIPGVPIIHLLVGVQVLNGLLLPVILLFTLLLANDRQLMGDMTNSRTDNILAWGTFAVITVAAVAMIVMQLSGIGS